MSRATQTSSAPAEASAAAAPASPQPDSLGTRLFRQAQQGDRGAFGQFTRLYQDRLYNAMLRMVGNPDDALELTQETLARALSKLDTYRGEAAPYTWLFRIAMNLAITLLRKRQNVGSLSSGNGQAASLAMATSSANEPREVAERHERIAQVLAAMDRLDPEHRIVLVMRDVEGFDYLQMAAVLEMPLNSLKSRLFRARMALREELSEYMK
jgi:RNA polymerase sigma-70 factor (ECF subfamily)